MYDKYLEQLEEAGKSANSKNVPSIACNHKGICPEAPAPFGVCCSTHAPAASPCGTGIFMVIVIVINCCVIIPVPPSFWPVLFPSWATAPLSFSDSLPP